MSSAIPGWSPSVERTFKEVLFRFLEEIHCTKSALYLLTSEDTYGLATQYGFGRRDALAAEQHPEEPLVVLARGQEGGSRSYNESSEIPDLAAYLDGAGTTRLLLAPLSHGSRLIGFVDARNKGRRARFTTQDVARATEIAATMVDLIRRLRLYPEDEDTTPVQEPSPVAEDEATEQAGRPPFDETALGELLNRARLLVRIGSAEAACVSVVSGSLSSSRVFSTGAFPAQARRAIVDHQRTVLADAGFAPPGPGSWHVGVRRVSDRAPSAARWIASAILVSEGDWAVTASAVTNRSGTDPSQPLDLLRRAAATALAGARARLVRRTMVMTLAEGMKATSSDLTGHLEAVSRLCWSLADALGCKDGDAEAATLAGLVHDLGLAQLVEQEGYRAPPGGGEHRRVFRRHVELGESRLREYGLDDLAAVVRSHHERWDGSGYPDGLSEEGIPLAARIVSVAEVWDVLTADHSYRQTLAPGRALAIIKAAAGSQFDPRLVAALEEVLEWR